MVLRTVASISLMQFFDQVQSGSSTQKEDAAASGTQKVCGAIVRVCFDLVESSFSTSDADLSPQSGKLMAP